MTQNIKVQASFEAIWFDNAMQLNLGTTMYCEAFESNESNDLKENHLPEQEQGVKIPYWWLHFLSPHLKGLFYWMAIIECMQHLIENHLPEQGQGVKIPYWWLHNPNHWALSHLLCAPLRNRTQFTFAACVRPYATHNSLWQNSQFTSWITVAVRSSQFISVKFTICLLAPGPYIIHNSLHWGTIHNLPPVNAAVGNWEGGEETNPCGIQKFGEEKI